MLVVIPAQDSLVSSFKHTNSDPGGVDSALTFKRLSFYSPHPQRKIHESYLVCDGVDCGICKQLRHTLSMTHVSEILPLRMGEIQS